MAWLGGDREIPGLVLLFVTRDAVVARGCGARL